MTIGVFDSGIGGLVFLRELDRCYPRASRIYLADHPNGPYGKKSGDEIINLTCARVRELADLGCDKVVIACNTASVIAIPAVRQALSVRNSKVEVFDIASPTIQFLQSNSSSGYQPFDDANHGARRIGVFATQATVRSDYFKKEISQLPCTQFSQVACHQLVDAIENAEPLSYIRTYVHAYVKQLYDLFSSLRPHVAVLACTHYSVIRRLFQEALGADCVVISQEDLLIGKMVNCDSVSLSDSTHFTRRLLTTGDCQRANTAANSFLGENLFHFESLQPIGVKHVTA